MTKTYVIHSIESSTQERVFVVEGQRITGTIPVFVAELVDRATAEVADGGREVFKVGDSASAVGQRSVDLEPHVGR